MGAHKPYLGSILFAMRYLLNGDEILIDTYVGALNLGTNLVV